MRRHFFHIDGGMPHRDEIGEELRDDHTAWLEAMRMARDIESNRQPCQFWHLDVREGEGVVFPIEIKTFRGR